MTHQHIGSHPSVENYLNERLLSQVRSHRQACLPKKAAAVEGCTQQPPEVSEQEHAVHLGKTLTLAVFQVLAGERSLAQMGHWFDWESQQRFEQHYGLVTRYRKRQQSRGTIVNHYRHAQVISARACKTTARTFEVSVVIRDATRVRAVALQLKKIRQRWRISALVIG